MAVALLEEVRYSQVQRAHHGLGLAVGKAPEQDVTFGVRVNVQAWVPVSAPQAVSRDRATGLVTIALLVHVPQAIQDAFQSGHAPTPRSRLKRQLVFSFAPSSKSASVEPWACFFTFCIASSATPVRLRAGSPARTAPVRFRLHGSTARRSGRRAARHERSAHRRESAECATPRPLLGQ